MSDSLQVTRLRQNPLGQLAPAGEPGDIVRVTDGHAVIFLLPAEFDRATEADLRYLLARQACVSR